MDNKLSEAYLEEIGDTASVLMKDENYFESSGSPHLIMDSEALGDAPELTDDEKALQIEELRSELHKTEDEIATLRQVLMSKIRHAQEIKKKMGITPMSEVKEDILYGVQAIRGSDTYQKTTAVVKAAKDKTSSTIVTASSRLSEKLGTLRNSNTFKSFEEKMGSAYTTVKGRFTTSKSFEENEGNNAIPMTDEPIESMNESANPATITPGNSA